MTRNELIEYMLKNSKTIVKQINEELGKTYEKDLNKIIKRAISDFYHTYKPKYYKRTYSLKYMYSVKAKNGIINMDFSSDYTHAPHRASNEYIFNLVFIGGWHGGASTIEDSKIPQWGEHPAEGIPYWRTPHPEYTRWGRRAEQDESPMQRIDDALANYENKLPSIQNNIIKKELSKWIR